MNLEEYAKTEYLDKITIEKNGKKYINEKDLNNLNLSSNEYMFLMKLIKKYNIEFVKDMITEKDRPTRVTDYDYTKVISEGLEDRDKPKIAKVEYQNSQKVYEDYSKLDEFIENEFIPKYVQMKKRQNPKINLKEYPSIQLNHIVDLRLSHDEEEHLFKYLEKNNIRVGGYSPTIDYDVTNYDCVRTYKDSKLPEYNIDPKVEKEMFEKLRETNDRSIRNQLIVDNLRLAKYVAFKYSLRSTFDLHEIESYAYEGLCKAVDNFNPNLGNRFSTYAYPTISGYVKRGLSEEEKMITSEKNITLFTIIKPYIETIEEYSETTLFENPNLIDDVIDLMITQGEIKESQRENVKKYLLRMIPLSLNDEEKEIFIIDDGGINDSIYINQLKESINDVLMTLTPREKQILELRWGLNGSQGLNLEETGRHFNLTRARIHQIEAKALRKLRHPSRSKKLKGYLNEDYDITNYAHAYISENNDTYNDEFEPNQGIGK